MNFKGKSNPLTQESLNAATSLLKIGEAELWTLLAVETKTCGYLPDRRPVILFERHIFHRQTNGIHDAANPSISAPTPGGYSAGGGEEEYNRLKQAITLNEHAALNSASWGIGQVMGFNSSAAGFTSAEKMVTAMIDDEDAQLMAIARYIMNRNLNQSIATHRWDDFAKAYNGPAYRENHYADRLAAAYEVFASGALPRIPVRQAQVLLTFLGFDPGSPDGLPGKRTTNAVLRFREQQGLGTSSTVDEPLIEALRQSLVPTS